MEPETAIIAALSHSSGLCISINRAPSVAKRGEGEGVGERELLSKKSGWQDRNPSHNFQEQYYTVAHRAHDPVHGYTS